MILNLENVGKITSAEIELNGITIIAGANNTGKSTVGKMLYCIYNSFYHIEEKVKEERKRSLRRILIIYAREITGNMISSSKALTIISDFTDNKEKYIDNFDVIADRIKVFIEMVTPESEIDYSESLEKIVGRVNDCLKIQDSELIEIILRKRLMAEFSMKVGHVNNALNKSSIELMIKSNKISFEINANEEIVIDSYMNLVKNIAYIDDPFVLDELKQKMIWREYRDLLDHRSDLLLKLMNIDMNKSDFGPLDELLAQKHMQNVYKAINEVCEGTISEREESNGFVYVADGLKGSLDITNLSTGIKTFAIMKTLLQNGSIDENGIIVLDEPEIHLHPEWQLKFAEIIVLIQKEFGENILLTTHSPYFLNAVEVYSQKYGITHKCRYYTTEEIDKRTTIKDVTGELEPIYKKLAEPLQILENLEYEN